MTASWICSSPRATWRRCRTSPRRTPTTCCCRPADGKFQEAGEAAGVASFAIVARRGPGRFQPGRPAGSGRREPLGKRASSGATPARTPATGSRSSCSSPAPNRDAIGAWVEVKRGDDGDAPRNHRRRRPCQRPERLVAFRAGRHAAGRGARGLAGRHHRRLASRRQQQFLHTGAWQAGAALGGK